MNYSTLIFSIAILLSSCNMIENNSNNKQISKIENHLNKMATNDTYSGNVLIALNEEILLEKAYGYANLSHKVPNNVNTKFGIASMGKMFTAVAIMQLKEQGKLNFDDYVGEFLPDYPNKTVKDSVTIHQLLVHTSGLSDFFNTKFELKAKHTVRTLEDYFSFFKDDSLLFTPGTKNSYSNSGYIVLGMIIEKLSATTYYDYVKQHIFTPVGMENTDCFETDSSIENLAEGYINLGKNNIWKTSTYYKGARGSSAGGAYSTLGDLHKFAMALKKNILISNESLAIMTMDQNNNNYGYGFSLNRFNDFEVYGHNGGAHGVSAELDIYKNADYIVVTLSNRGALNGWVDVRSMIREELAGSTEETDKFLGSKELIEIYKSEGYEAALEKLHHMEGKVSQQYLMDAANKFRESKQYKKAIDLLKLLVIGIPDSWYCYSILADTYLDAGNKELAIENYHNSLKLEPKNEWAIEKLEMLNVK